MFSLQKDVTLGLEIADTSSRQLLCRTQCNTSFQDGYWTFHTWTSLSVRCCICNVPGHHTSKNIKVRTVMQLSLHAKINRSPVLIIFTASSECFMQLRSGLKVPLLHRHIFIKHMNIYITFYSVKAYNFNIIHYRLSQVKSVKFPTDRIQNTVLYFNLCYIITL